MALIKAETATGFSRLPAFRQITLMVGLSASIALGVAIVLWSQSPVYSLLYGNLSNRDSSEILAALQQNNIPYKVDQGSGAVMVPAGKVHEARLKLAGQGLPKGGGVGFEVLDKDQAMGTSQFLEQARYKRAVEVELARSIRTMRSVQSARIHLAIPKRTVFIRKKTQPTASVVLQLYAGHSLDSGQIASIVNLVAAAVPNLQPNRVTIVDQNGRLLSSVSGEKGMAASSHRFEYTKQVESTYVKRIENLISPIVGDGGVRAQVVAQIDFTSTEKTQESYNPDMPALRSEQIVERKNQVEQSKKLRSTPPAAGEAAPAGTPPASPVQPNKSSSSKKSTRNYELDKTISHTKIPGGRITRLSIAVVLNDKQTVNEDGEVERTPLSDKELATVTNLVKKAVGFNAARGDTISVTNSSFFRPPAPEAVPDAPIMEQPWVQNLIKQGLGALGVLFIILFVLKPVLRSLAEKGAEPEKVAMTPEMLAQMAASGAQGLPNMEGADGMKLPGGGGYEEQVSTAKSLAAQDPARVAQVVKSWVANDG